MIRLDKKSKLELLELLQKYAGQYPALEQEFDRQEKQANEQLTRLQKGIEEMVKAREESKTVYAKMAGWIQEIKDELGMS